MDGRSRGEQRVRKGSGWGALGWVGGGGGANRTGIQTNLEENENPCLGPFAGGESPGKTRQRRESVFFLCIHVILFLLQQFGNKLIIIII
jgi:hypothetical protein